jgi:ubiquinone/menaquinone biosynthesis C-methylase UbiE
MHDHATASAPHSESSGGGTLHAPRLYDIGVFFYAWGREGRFRARILDVAGVAEGEHVLDVCCGTGTLALAAKDRVGASGVVHGVDAAPEMIERARTKAARRGLEATFHVSSAETLPFADGTFDVVLCTLGVHHLPVAVREPVFAEMHRVLRPGGRVLIVEFVRQRGIAALHPVAWLHSVTGSDLLQTIGASLEEHGFEHGTVAPLGFPGLGYLRAHRH